MMRSSYQHSRRSARRVLARLLAALGVVIVLAVAFVIVQLARAVPSASASVARPSRLSVAAAGSAMPWPSSGEADVVVQGVGGLGGVHTNRAVPLASITKLVAALVLLHDHPLSLGQSGPSIPITAADAAAYRAERAANDSVVRVVAGEQLSEYQALEGMLIPSGDNVASIAARWDAPSTAAFVERMNAEAAALGLHHTHLADPSGLDAASVGSAADLITLGEAVMAQPVLRSIVAMPQVTLPAAGTVYNYDNDLGSDGIVGIKTGSTLPAGGNFLFAARDRVDGRTVTIIGAVLGQGGKQILQHALDVAKRLVKAAVADVRMRTVVEAGTPEITLRAPWGPVTVVGRAARPVRVLSVPGETFPARVVPSALLAHPVRSLRAGSRLGTLVIDVDGRPVDDPIVATGGFSPPTLAYRLTRI
jgi:D-alanyl-D-alanine carboxypeptidase (penicillin-binding protein 5/6)